MKHVLQLHCDKLKTKCDFCYFLANFCYFLATDIEVNNFYDQVSAKIQSVIHVTN